MWFPEEVWFCCNAQTLPRGCHAGQRATAVPPGAVACRGSCHRAGARAYLGKHMGKQMGKQMGTHSECAVFRMHGDVAERLKAAVC